MKKISYDLVLIWRTFVKGHSEKYLDFWLVLTEEKNRNIGKDSILIAEGSLSFRAWRDICVTMATGG